MKNMFLFIEHQQSSLWLFTHLQLFQANQGMPADVPAGCCLRSFHKEHREDELSPALPGMKTAFLKMAHEGYHKNINPEM